MDEGLPKETMIFQCTISPHEIVSARFWPAIISKQGQPEVLPLEDDRGRKIAALMRALCQKFGTGLSAGDHGVEIIL
jgi:hypothetical protein